MTALAARPLPSTFKAASEATKPLPTTLWDALAEIATLRELVALADEDRKAQSRYYLAAIQALQARCEALSQAVTERGVSPQVEEELRLSGARLARLVRRERSSQDDELIDRLIGRVARLRAAVTVLAAGGSS